MPTPGKIVGRGGCHFNTKSAKFGLDSLVCLCRSTRLSRAGSPSWTRLEWTAIHKDKSNHGSNDIQEREGRKSYLCLDLTASWDPFRESSAGRTRELGLLAPSSGSKLNLNRRHTKFGDGGAAFLSTGHVASSRPHPGPCFTRRLTFNFKSKVRIL